MRERLEMILKNDQLSRMQFGEEEVTIDLHKMKSAECCWLVRTVIASIRNGFQLNLIHGYNHGTVLKEMLRGQKMSSRVTNLYSDPWNPGLTHMNISKAA